MSLEHSIAQITKQALSRVNVRAANGMTLVPAENGKPLLSRAGSARGEEGFSSAGYPRNHAPVLQGNHFTLNLFPVRGVTVDLSEEFPLINAKLYLELAITPVSYLVSLGVFGLSYGIVTGLNIVAVPHGTIPPPRVPPSNK